MFKSIRLVDIGWFNTPSKCSIHMLDCSSSVVNVRPALLLMIGMLEILLELVNSRTILYIVLVSFLFAASCASAPLDSVQCLLSLLQLYFTSFSFSLYFSSCVFHPCESFVWSHVFLVLFRSSIRSQISQEIHLSWLVPLLFPNIFAALSAIPLTNTGHCSSRSVECSRPANLFLVSKRTFCDAVWSFSFSYIYTSKEPVCPRVELILKIIIILLIIFLGFIKSKPC